MPVFRIVSSQILNRHFEDLCAQADAEGRGSVAIKAVENIMTRLQDNPLAIGEVLYHLKIKNWPVCHVVNSPWSVHFVVDEEQHVVYLSKFTLLD